MSQKTLKLLIVEDADSDVVLITRLFRRAGYDLSFLQVQDSEQMRLALNDTSWDAIVSDFCLPQFDGLTALLLRQALAPHIPFIILSGAVGEGRAVELVKAGANDFVTKNKFPRLVQVVEREIAQAQIRLAHQQEQQAVLHERKRLKAILNGASDGIILIDRQGVLLSANPAAEKIFGSCEQCMLGKNIRDILPVHNLEVDAGDTLALLQAGAREESGRRCERIGRRCAGEEFPMEFSFSSWYDGEQEHFICLMRDITELKRMQSQLSQTQKMESLMQLSGGLAHDFNNLLGIIIGNLDMLEARLQGDAKSLAQVDSALRAALRGADITRRMLTLSRLQHGSKRHEPMHDINVLVEEIVAILQRTLGPTYEIATALLPDLPPIKVDPAEFENVLLNLALNARDAMPNGGHLIIATRLVRRSDLPQNEVLAHLPEADYLLLEVTDTGHGMAPEVLGNALTPFFTTKTGSGTGLGLSMVYSFVKAQNGYLKLHSEVGYGTAVHLYLPLTTGAGAPPQDKPDAAPLSTGGHETILVVDDELPLLELAVEHLHHLGYKTVAAQNAADALAQLHSHPEIDLLLTDVVMPGGMLGTELAVQAQSLRPELPVILCSGFPKKIQDDPRYAKFVADILPKPFRKADLAHAVRSKLDHAMAEAGV